ncbi:MAG: hydroxyethylthiazole kinase [Candidatus Limnocylindrales bacterium]
MTRRPVIHCLTNEVTIGRVADVLAAAGAAPIMASAAEEVAEIAARADAVILNCGTPDPARLRVLCLAGAAARESGIPVVLDPVGCGASVWRTERIRGLVATVRPTIVRGGAAEIAALTGLASDAELQGVSSQGGDAVALAQAAANRLSAVVIVGAAISDGSRSAWNEIAAPILGRVVGAGDVLDALIALACVGQADRFIAAERGYERFVSAATAAAAGGPGAFWPAFIDAVAADRA